MGEQEHIYEGSIHIYAVRIEFECDKCGRHIYYFSEMPKPYLRSEKITHSATITNESDLIVCEYCGQEYGVELTKSISGSTVEIFDLEDENETLQIELYDDREVEENVGSLNEYVPVTDRDLAIEHINFSIYELYRRYLQGSLELHPPYQRKHQLWDSQRKSKLIESALRRIPIPSLYLNEKENGLFEVVDGQQRLLAFFDYLNNDFPLAELPILTLLNDLKFQDLSAVYQRKIQDYRLHIFIIRKESHPDIKFDIFGRINSGAIKLNDQELRNSIYRNGEIDFLEQLASDEYFKKMIPKHFELRLKHHEAVLRFLAFYLHGYSAYLGHLNPLLNATLDRFPGLDKQDELSFIFSQTMEIIYDIFKADAFVRPNIQSRRINMGFFDVLTTSVALYVDKKEHLLKHQGKIMNEFYTLATTNEYFKSNKASTEYVHRRFEIWLNRLNKIVDGEG